MDIKDKLAAKLLSEWRAKQGITQQELANKAGISRGLITQIETFRKKVSESTLLKILKALYPDKEPAEILNYFKINLELKLGSRSDLKHNIIISESLIASKDELQNLELETDGRKTLLLSMEYFIDIENENTEYREKTTKMLNKLSKIEDLPEKYAIEIGDKIYNASLSSEIRIWDIVVIEYYDNYDLKNVKNNSIIVLFNDKTGEKFLTKLKILKYIDDDDFIYSCSLDNGNEIAFKNIGDFKIKGLAVLIIRYPVIPNTEYYFL